MFENENDLMNGAIDEALSEAEANMKNGSGADYDFTITMKSESGSQPCVEHVRVKHGNTLGQLVMEVGDDLYIDVNAKLCFKNKATGRETNDVDMTVDEFGLVQGDVLLVYDDRNVA